MSTPVIVRTVEALRAHTRAWRAAGEVIGVVPTMGALHDGHLSLARAARRDCDRVITTIFVNPMQFNNPDDLLKYPRTEEADAALLATVPVDLIFAPAREEVYPDGFKTTVSVAGVSEPLEGRMRPGHFDGVATVVTKLFGMTMADRGYFGQKDWQQLQVVLRLVRDLNLAVQIVGCETIREPDGLAMSSRNVRLTPAGRARASVLYTAITAAAEDIRAGQSDRMAIREAAEAIRAAGFDRVEYIELRDAATLMPSDDPASPRRMLAAAWLDGVRLIDNIPV
ncbi:pantoate--beta-alanine ligase [Pseudorhodobacter sp. MZDSW-24AT]|uniref:pantoate--beta-alanine ligase n=1 Tax=Pseudorhodobacter sp. MZDSW-24AT TaxID=2052957 RepID=UPI000C1E2C7B|nr:pantoate--beta-alanine ligase [Pseudorhodobacter sp. MZDSW-24AT]PJF08683.1 pantoate--beta-alanine ligase [Pseudorhodobacter sp. MZDSW-24AT]